SDVDHAMALPEGIGLAVHRIIQEAVTNTIRHSDAGRLAISVDAITGLLRVEVADDGHPAPSGTPPADGLGLMGMRERVMALGGRLEHGRMADGGYRVAAVLPLPTGEEP